MYFDNHYLLILDDILENLYTLGNIDYILQLCKKYGDAIFPRLPIELRNNKQFILNGFTQERDCESYFSISEKLKRDRDFIHQLVKFNPHIYQFIYFKSDEEIALTALEIIDVNFIHLPSILRSNRDFIEKSLNINPKIAPYVITDLYSHDEKIILLSLEKDASYFYFCNDELKCNKEFIIKALEINSNVFHYLDPQFQNDEYFNYFIK